MSEDKSTQKADDLSSRILRLMNKEPDADIAFNGLVRAMYHAIASVSSGKEMTTRKGILAVASLLHDIDLKVEEAKINESKT